VRQGITGRCLLFTESMVRGEQREGVGILHVGKTAKAAAIAVAVVLHVVVVVAGERAGVTE
jgi:hypothetical protein